MQTIAQPDTYLKFMLESKNEGVRIVPMDAALGQLRIISGALIASVLLYLFIGERIPRQTQTADPVLYQILALVAIAMVVAIFVVRRKTVVRAITALGAHPDDREALARWRGGSSIIYVLCEVLALYGFILRLLGFSLSQVAPFYLGALALMLYFYPRRLVFTDQASGPPALE